jgi:hypothetical protein
MAGVSDLNILETFDRVIVVNLARRPERLVRFRARLSDWPFHEPRPFEAVDGAAAGTPPGWDKGPGAWGCLLSHRRILDCAIQEGVKSLFVLEDDACPAENFAALASQFLRNVPGDWDGLMFGAEHLMQSLPIGPSMVRCIASNRSHAYAVRGRFMGVLSQAWANTTNDHCDVVLASLMRHFNVYAPDPLLIRQDYGHSDISGQRENLRFLSADQKNKIGEPDPRHLIEKLVVRVPAI